LKELQKAEGCKRGEGAAAEGDAEDDAGENVAQEMHAENDAREGDTDCEENKRKFERRIKIREHERDRRGGHGVAGRKRKLVRRKDLGPAVRFQLAGTRTVAEPLERFEDEDADDGGKRGGANGGKTMRTAEEKKKDSRGIPDPTVAKTRGREHPKADPPRGAPAVQAPHQAMIAALNETPDITGNGHFKTPVKNNRPQKNLPASRQKKSGSTQSRVQIPKPTRSGIGRVHKLRPFLAKANFVRPMADGNCRQQNGEGK